jgi:hypothetical protein
MTKSDTSLRFIRFSGEFLLLKGLKGGCCAVIANAVPFAGYDFGNAGGKICLSETCSALHQKIGAVIGEGFCKSPAALADQPHNLSGRC